MRTLTLKELIIIHINYRDVFNAVVDIKELQNWMGITDSEQLRRELKELVAEGLVETQDHFNYWVAGRSEIALNKISKKKLSEKCLKNHERIIKWLSLLPFIRLIGISGSIAVNNATIHKDGLYKDAVDLDIFVITTANALWLVFYVERLVTNLLIFFLGRRYVFCFNYAMDFSFLEIHNKNLFTATELFNLKPMYDKDNTYQLLLKSNAWVEKYYPSLISDQTEIKKSNFKIRVSELVSMVLYPFNLIAFYLLHLSRGVKNRSWRPLTEATLEFNPTLGKNLTRINPPNGGYEQLIMERFENKLKNNFSNYYRTDLMTQLFPKQDIKASEDDIPLEKSVLEAFAKYTV